MIDEIKSNLNKRLENVPDSRAAGEDAVRIAWLVCRIEKLEDVITAAKDSLKGATIGRQAECINRAIRALDGEEQTDRRRGGEIMEIVTQGRAFDARDCDHFLCTQCERYSHLKSGHFEGTGDAEGSKFCSFSCAEAWAKANPLLKAREVGKEVGETHFKCALCGQHFPPGNLFYHGVGENEGDTYCSRSCAERSS